MSKRKTTEEFIAQAIEVHKNKYTYSDTTYINARSKVNIECPVHGTFTQTPDAHLRGAGCPHCGFINTAKARRSSTENFIVKAKEIHKDTYSYYKTNYINNWTKVTITCPIHGDFEQSPNNHLAGNGCLNCGIKKLSDSKRGSKEQFIKRAISTHGDKYDYSKVRFIATNEKIEIVCKVHGSFTQLPAHHIRGVGCPKCASYGFNPNKPAYLYYLRVTTEDNQVLYKIGITNRTVTERFQLADLQKIEIVKQRLYSIGQDALDWENRLKYQFKQYIYKGSAVLSSGNTELFTEDIMELWHANQSIS